MNIKRAIVSAVVLYALIFLAASTLLFMRDNFYFGVLTLAIGSVLTFVISKYYYFKGMKFSSAVREGLMLGIFMAAVTFAIEIPVMVYGFAKDQGWGYFTAWHMMLGYLFMIVLPVFAAYKK